jgi:hypothetical protein
MSEQVLKRYQELIESGSQLVPMGGFDFSGYNARLQKNYLEWRKACLELLELSGPIGFPYKNKILNDHNGGFFYQSSAQLIQNCLKELHDKLKASPELAASLSSPASQPGAPGTQTETSGVRVLKPPPKKPQAAPAPTVPQRAPAASAGPATDNRVYVIGEKDDPLRIQLEQFLTEIGLDKVPLDRQKGQMLALDSLQERSDVKYAFFVINPEDLQYAMFELGHFVGKLGNGRVCALHMSDVNFPKNIPGVSAKSIVVRLEEASLGLMKELKALGFKISI